MDLLYCLHALWNANNFCIVDTQELANFILQIFDYDHYYDYTYGVALGTWPRSFILWCEYILTKGDLWPGHNLLYFCKITCFGAQILMLTLANI